jgi:hypothetical protein
VGAVFLTKVSKKEQQAIVGRQPDLLNLDVPSE